jgi:hypothetical protein
LLSNVFEKKKGKSSREIIMIKIGAIKYVLTGFAVIITLSYSDFETVYQNGFEGPDYKKWNLFGKDVYLKGYYNMGYQNGLEGSEFKKRILFGKDEYLKGYSDGKFASTIGNKFANFCDKLKDSKSEDYEYHCLDESLIEPQK